MKSVFGIFVGMLFGVTNAYVNLTVNGGVGNDAITVLEIDVGTSHVGTITAVVPGINTTDLAGTDDGTDENGIITGDYGIVGTTIYWLDGTFGILFGVTNAVLNLMVYGVTGNV